MAIALWTLWTLLTLAAGGCWWVLHSLVSKFVRKGLLLVPLDRPLAKGAPKVSFPAAEAKTRAGEIEEAVIRFIPTGLLRWLVRLAFRFKTSDLLESLQAYCTARKIEIIDEKVLAAWLHTHVAQMLGDIAGEIASGFFRLAFFILLAVGIGAAWWRWR